MGNAWRTNGPHDAGDERADGHAVDEKNKRRERAKGKLYDRSGHAPDDGNDEEEDVGSNTMVHGESFCMTAATVNSSCVSAFMSFNFTTSREISSGP